jgi:MSHA biogenesis protein MshK
LVFSFLLLLTGTADVGLSNVPALEDPTRPLDPGTVETRPATKTSIPTLTSILVGKERKLAVIDGRLMSEGENVQGIRVLKIYPDRAVVSVGDERSITLTLGNARIHKEKR